jgi:hypothetical protein
MVGASALAETARDLQDYAAAYTEDELAREIEVLRGRVSALKEAVARLLHTHESPA